METPMLEQLVGAYFHPDWADDADEDATVRQFLTEAPGSAGIAEEIDWVLAAMPTEDEVRTYLLELGSCYTPAAGEGGYRDWLRSIAARAADSARGGATS
jgi:hypothetical protein